jgi:MFS family permease
VLAGVAFSVAVGFGVVAPAIPTFARSFGVSRTAASGVISIFALMRFVSALLGGRLVNRFGERVVLAAGIAIVAVSSAAAGAAQTYLQLLLLRGAGGVGSAMFTVSAMSLLLRSVGADVRGRAVGFFSAGFLLGGILGPSLGSAVTGLGLRAPFFLYAGTLAVAGGIGLLLLPRKQLADRTAEGEVVTTTLGQAARMPAYRAALVSNAADAWAVLGVRSALIPLFVTESLHLGRGWIGIGFTIVSAVNAGVLAFAGRLSDTRGRKPVLLFGVIVSGLAMTLLAVAPSTATYVVSMVLFGFGSGALDVAPGAMVGDVVGGRGGTPVAAYQMSGDLGVVVGPLASGKLADTLGYGPAFGLTASMFAVATVFALRAPETRVVDIAETVITPP